MSNPPITANYGPTPAMQASMQAHRVKQRSSRHGSSSRVPFGAHKSIRTVPFRFPAAVQLTGLGSISDALVGRVRWDTPEVLTEIARLYKRSQGPAFLEQWRERAAERFAERFVVMQEAQRRAFGTNSFGYHKETGANPVQRSREYLLLIRAKTVHGSIQLEEISPTMGEKLDRVQTHRHQHRRLRRPGNQGFGEDKLKESRGASEAENEQEQAASVC
ncbi:hypothetical protein FQN54_007627 [Arachnomyces sp. PD_36]|nr:hypothetical protein FQN54_007627 [Arachnomyces sp. PD_36]